MASPLIRKLESLGKLPEADKRLLEGLSDDPLEVGARVDLIREGDPPTHVHLILEGFACRYKMTADGRRQIMAYLLPGDFCDLHVFLLKEMDHTIATLSPCKVVRISRARIMELTNRPAIARALLWVSLVDGATLREWLLNVGARSAEERVAHLLCEMLMRLQLVGLAQGGAYELPITQVELADTTGISNVHINRVLQKLRADKLISLRGKQVVILDIPRLKALSGFNPNYLHMGDQRKAPEPGPGAKPRN